MLAVEFAARGAIGDVGALLVGRQARRQVRADLLGGRNMSGRCESKQGEASAQARPSLAPRVSEIMRSPLPLARASATPSHRIGHTLSRFGAAG